MKPMTASRQTVMTRSCVKGGSSADIGDGCADARAPAPAPAPAPPPTVRRRKAGDGI